MQSNLTDRTILVTGGAGFIGSHIVDALHRDNDVRVLDDFSGGTRLHLPTDVEVFEGDLRDEELLGRATCGVDYVFHEAALVSVAESVTHPRVCHETNASATLALLDHARMEDARVILASSAAVYGHPDEVPVSETAPTAPQSPYGVSKLAGDCYARRFADLYDLPTVVLRYFNVYGPRQAECGSDGVVSVFLDQLREGGPVTINGDGTQTRDFVHVSDVVRANLLAATADVSGRAYNVGTGRRVSIAELAELLCEATDTDGRIVHQDERPGDVQHSCADVGRASRELGYEPAVDLEDGLAALADRRVLSGAE